MLCSSCPAIAEFPNGQNLIVPKPVLDVTHTVASHIHGENLLHNMSGFRVGDKVIAVVRVSDIPVGDFSVDTFAPLGLGLLHRPDFLGSIAGVKFIEHISKYEDQKTSAYYAANGSKVCSVKSGPFLVPKIVINEVV